ncbi:MAG: RluA family pseudouridine synthase [Bacilli bacterium]|jgi:23S rRNA pseudouridine1911/1915/1917 synthase|nr:RluA family pseudouridine synthase [Bacilli bacterium]HHU23989.1 RluA family pseudouridine synthase [Acholeplasmataceae bacterium]
MNQIQDLILYEDNHLLVVHKPAGILSQRDETNDPDMLTMLKQYLKVKYQKPGNVYLGLVHRLDRMTRGVMVFAKTSKAASRLFAVIRNRAFKKYYYALVNGVLPDSSGKMVDYLIKDEKEVKSFVTNYGQGKIAILNYQVIKHLKGTTLVEVSLETGRHHQIRVQFASRGFPLLGDTLYGSSVKMPLALYAFKLEFPHPVTQETLTFEVKPQGKPWDDYLR